MEVTRQRYCGARESANPQSIGPAFEPIPQFSNPSHSVIMDSGFAG
jgi:hypothetical protein